MQAPKTLTDYIKIIGKVDPEKIVNCPVCIEKGRGNYPISPAVGYCRRCRLDGQRD